MHWKLVLHASVASRRIKRLLLKRNVVDAKVVPSVALFSMLYAKAIRAAVHTVRTCLSRFLLALLVRRGRALLTP